MSGFLGDLMGPLAQVLGAAEGAGAGWLPAIVAQLENAGLAEKVRSWVGHGENQPLTAAELGGALTPEQLSSLAARTGTEPAVLLESLANELPDAVHRATPTGVRPGKP